MKKSLVFIGLIAFIFSSYGQQIIEMEEGDVEMKVLTWHYDKYQKSKDVTWSLIVENGEGYYEADFDYEGNEYKSAYSTDGFILWEKAFFSEKNVPAKVTEVLDYRVVKYKIEYFTKYVEFDEMKKAINTQYNVLAITKTGGQVEYWFDESFNLIPEKKSNEVARR
jgi:hypothetical protein